MGYTTTGAKNPTFIDKIGTRGNDEEIEWLDVKEPLDLVDISKESVYESLIKEVPKCSLNYDFRIKKGDPRNLKIPCMIGHKFTANAYIDVDLPMNIYSIDLEDGFYKDTSKLGPEYVTGMDDEGEVTRRREREEEEDRREEKERRKRSMKDRIKEGEERRKKEFRKKGEKEEEDEDRKKIEREGRRRRKKKKEREMIDWKEKEERRRRRREKKLGSS
ncbi:hypothetical protein Tco_1538028 [Tanacetum coccineum]